MQGYSVYHKSNSNTILQLRKLTLRLFRRHKGSSQRLGSINNWSFSLSEHFRRKAGNPGYFMRHRIYESYDRATWMMAQHRHHHGDESRIQCFSVQVLLKKTRYTPRASSIRRSGSEAPASGRLGCIAGSLGSLEHLDEPSRTEKDIPIFPVAFPFLYLSMAVT